MFAYINNSETSVVSCMSLANGLTAIMRGKINKIISINQTSSIRSSVVDKQHLQCAQEPRWSSKNLTKKKTYIQWNGREKKSRDQKDLMRVLFDYNIDTI